MKKETLRNIIAAIKYTAKKFTYDDILLAWERNEHRVGIIYPYLNNDIGCYYYLDKYIELCYKNLGVKTRISTIGYSRHNERLNNMHKRISKLLPYAIGGIRLSISQYGRVWEDKSGNYSLDEYIKDLGNFLKIYKPYMNAFGTGFRKMCVELRYNPFVAIKNVYDFTYKNKKVIATGNYLFISKEENPIFNESSITDPYVHSLVISENPIYFNEYTLPKEMNSVEELIEYLDNNILTFIREKECYLFSNVEGNYYCFDPKMTNEGNYGINVYPKTSKRLNSGYIITERFFLNSLIKIKKKYGLSRKQKFKNATWKNVNEAFEELIKIAEYYKNNNKVDKYNYINKHVIPIIDTYIKILKNANYSPSLFFDSDFTIDTGIICNIGRAIN